MASWSPEPDAGAPCFSVFRGCSPPKTASGLLVAFSGLVEPRAPGRLSSGSSVRGVSTSEGAVPGRATPAAKGPGVGLPRNVLSERERRKRISASCERLRALLPQFEGRREDMASVLEVAVQFLQLARCLASGWEQPGTLQLPVSAKDAWSPWCQSIRHLTLASQSPATKPSSEAGAPGETAWQDPHLNAVLGTEESKSSPGLVKGLDVLSPSPGLTPGQPLRPPPWQPSLGQLAASEAREEAPGVQGPAGQSLRARGAASPGRKAKEAELALPRVPSARSVPGPDVEEGTSFLLTASPDWWLGSLDGRGRGAPNWAASRSSLLTGMEPGFPSDPEPGPGPQELPDGPLEPWGSDVGSLGLALREETDSIFPDFLAC
ncbi:spermatogenesis- and oogenesis-specific basic helix-loop-helix-containing protein 1 [Ochotona princeps]|uniref:spermatogenesis- and oogenesis-specific basic helix-loop-helix-containing protein 1 n=1 Tax=Ochotona princeps TaxID=9978 RepID=UPI0027147801|nr:spermatogenesis- and oogenesis-specific basic helix-loop-helix-containing protein 1 [Ochotona princeps]